MSATPLRETTSLAEGQRPKSALQVVNPADMADWDAQVMAQPNYLFFHCAAWARVLEKTYDFKPTYLANLEQGVLRSMLPLMEVRSWLTGRRGVGLPFTDHSGPLCSDPGSFAELFWKAVERGKTLGWRSVECRGGRELLDGAPASLAFYGHILDLEGGEDRLLGRMKSSARGAIRKAEKSGLKVNVSRTPEAMREYYALQCKTRKKHGLPPQPFALFKNIQEQILARNLGFIVTASHQNRPVAAAVYFQLGDRAIYKFSASDEEYQALRGANLVMWEAIKCLAGKGAKTLHLGRTSGWNGGLRHFKLAWGAGEHRIEYVKYDLRTGRFVMDKDESSGWHNHIFRRMPVGFSRLLGSILYRHWA